MYTLLARIADLEQVRATGAPAEAVKTAQQQLRAQFLVDFIEAENAMAFHADQEAARILGQSIAAFRKGQVAPGPLPPPR